ncbi:MAG TPA: glycosyltransferase family 4 protein, partial [Cyclobacteriaceae bacterium]|nr:glycosyltransferase family 4 protein [Cyclobacteriaceae bacterium]
EYLTADVFCFPSFVESESFGNVIAEAMMFSLPVIATKWNAIPELVEDGVTGYLVPVEDAVKLAEKIKLLAENPALRIRLGSKGREKFISEFLLDTHLNNMEKMFVEVAAM